MQNELLTLAEAAERLGVAVDGLHPSLAMVAELRGVAVEVEKWPIKWLTHQVPDPEIGLEENRWILAGQSDAFSGVVCLESRDVGAIVFSGSAPITWVRRQRELGEPSIGQVGPLADGSKPTVRYADVRVFAADVALLLQVFVALQPAFAAHASRAKASLMEQVTPILFRLVHERAKHEGEAKALREAAGASKNADTLADATRAMSTLVQRTTMAEDRASRLSESPPPWKLPEDVTHEQLASLFNMNLASHSTPLEAAVRLWLTACLALGPDEVAIKGLTTAKLKAKLTTKFSVRVANNTEDVARVALPDIARRSGRKPNHSPVKNTPD